MFWQYENGKLLNLNAVELIYVDQHYRKYRVMASRRDDEPVDLFISEKEEDAIRVLKTIGDLLGQQGALVREAAVKAEGGVV